MAKQHKYAGAHIRVKSPNLKAEKLLALVKDVAGTFKEIEVLGEDEDSVLLMVKSIARMNILEFTVTAEDTADGSTAVTEIGEYLTNQGTIFLVIPLGPKEMNGYRSYKKFMELYGKAVQAVDSSARSSITELTGTPGR